MKILFIAPSYKPAYIYGGPVVVISLLAESLIKLGHNVTVYTTRADTAEIEILGTVQVNKEQFSIILRVPETGKMDEITARRLGFEVLEMAIKVEERQRKIVERRGGRA